ncbi:MAG: DNA mismatch repair protein MutS, partial [Bdellovibrionales bacterium]|nr:DNA mismatch repair protein MutS [Bdellovibrionales bacterium]
ALNDLLYLDATTAEHLELFSTKSSLASSHHLFEVLDKTMTSMGSRQLRRWMQCPLKDIKKIRVRQDAIEELVEKVDTRKKLRDILKGVYDMERLITRIASQRSNARDLIALRTSLHHVLQVGREMNNLDSLLLSEVKLNLEVDQDFLKLMDQMLCEDPPFSVREGGMFNPGVSRELDEYRLAKTNGKQWLSALEAKERQTTGISTLKIRYNRVFGYFLEVTKGQISKVPSSYERRQTLTNAERYITPELKEYESKILSAEEKIQQIEYDLFEHLREQVMGKRGAIGQIAKGLSTLDVLLSLAEVADQNAYTRPVVSENQILDIQDGRHPIVEAFVRTEAFVPNSLKLNADTRLVILTGPNMAGKSTIMRQMALIIYMAQLGSFVPATAAHIGVVDRIFTRVGASDDLSRGRSTFMVEMNEAANILRNATKNSFVVLDEIGRGTSTYDGLAIAWAVAEDLHDRIQCKAIFATHYHELTELAAKKPAIHNLNVAIKEWQGELIFIRKLAEGAVSRSYGIEVAKMAGVPHQVVERAKSVMKAFENVEAVPVNEDAKQIPTPKASQEEWLEDLFKVDCHTMTPLEAINLISIWQKRYKK